MSLGVALHPFVGRRLTHDGAAQLFQRLAVGSITSHGGVGCTPDSGAECLAYFWRGLECGNLRQCNTLEARKLQL